VPGKTTFFNMLTGVYKPTAGQIVSTGHDVTARPPHAIPSAGSATFPEHPLFQSMTCARERARRACTRAEGRHPAGGIKPPIAEARGDRRAGEGPRPARVLRGSRAATTSYARNLAYGDQRRLEVARALATEPKLLLLDEPTAGMNPQETAEFTAFVAKLREERGPDRADDRARHARRDGHLRARDVLDYGEKIAEGTPQECRATSA
jgi:branched-chain amino acid transport system ATP-binding protein